VKVAAAPDESVALLILPGCALIPVVEGERGDFDRRADSRGLDRRAPARRGGLVIARYNLSVSKPPRTAPATPTRDEGQGSRRRAYGPDEDGEPYQRDAGGYVVRAAEQGVGQVAEQGEQDQRDGVTHSREPGVHARAYHGGSEQQGSDDEDRPPAEDHPVRRPVEHGVEDGWFDEKQHHVVGVRGPGEQPEADDVESGGDRSEAAGGVRLAEMERKERRYAEARDPSATMKLVAAVSPVNASMTPATPSDRPKITPQTAPKRDNPSSVGSSRVLSAVAVRRSPSASVDIVGSSRVLSVFRTWRRRAAAALGSLR